jgi:hypothetical protein
VLVLGVRVGGAAGTHSMPQIQQGPLKETGAGLPKEASELK